MCGHTARVQRERERGVGEGRSSGYVDSKQKVIRALLTGYYPFLFLVSDNHPH